MADASKLVLQEQKQKEWRNTLAAVGDELVNQEQKQKEQRQRLVEYASDLGKQELRQNKQQKKLTADISELHKQEKRYKKLKRNKLKQKWEQKSVEPKILGSKLNESGTIQKWDKWDIGELQRQGQEELTDLELPSFFELKYEEIDADQSAPEVQAQNYSMNTVQKDGTQVDVSAPQGENNPAQEHRPQQNRAQVKSQEKRLMKEAHESEAQERSQEHGVQERGREHQTQENGQEDRAYEDAAHNDKTQGGRQVDEAQDVVHEDKAHKEGQDGGVYEDEVQEYWAQKCWEMTEVSDNDAALWAQWMGRTKTCEKGQVSMA